MTLDGPQRIFISYARIDGAELAGRLRVDLQKSGHIPWLDVERIAGGESWTPAIESALDDANVVLALLSQGSYMSEICRAEQLRALRKGKCVIPVLARTPADVPLHLETKNYRDFSTGVYDEPFRQLLDDIRRGDGVVLRDEYARTYVTAPPMPENFVPRPAMLATLRDAVMRERRTANLPLTGLSGMGGIGKTLLAQALCSDEVIQQAFPDGVIWLTIGKDPAYDLLTRLRELGKALRDDPTAYDNELGSRNRYRTTIRRKAALIVLDDVWSVRDIDAFRAESQRSALLFTTRDLSIAPALGAFDVAAGSLTLDEARAVLARWAALDPGSLPAEANDLIVECGRLPLAVAVVGARLRGKPPSMWQRQLEVLRSGDLARIRVQFPEYPHPTLFRAIEVSVDDLDAVTRQRYLALAVLLNDTRVLPSIQQTLWQADEGDATDTAERLIELSLAQRDADGTSFRLHGLQLDFVRSQFPDQEALSLIHGALRLSSDVLMRDPDQFRAQLSARLLPHESNGTIVALTRELRQYPRKPWLRAITSNVTPPGGALLLQFRATEPAAQPGEAEGLSVLALNGSQIVSAAFGSPNLTVWDIETGAPLKTLAGHTARIVALSIAPDGRRAVSASVDGTMRIWDLDRGTSVGVIQQPATALAAEPDAHRFIAGAADGRVTLFDLDSGDVHQTLSGMDASVEAVALAANRYVVAACAGGALTVWDLVDGGGPRMLADPSGTNGDGISQTHIAMLADSERVAVACGKRLTIWDVKAGRLLRTLEREQFGFDAMVALHDSRSVIYACLMDILEVMDTSSGEVLQKLPNTAARVAFLAVTPDGRRAVTAVNSGELRVWDLHAPGTGPMSPRHSRWVRALSLTEGGKYVVSISLDGALLWDLNTGTVVHSFGPEWGLNPFADSVLSDIPGPWNRLEALLPEARAISVVNGRTLQIGSKGGNGATSEVGSHEGAIQVVRATADGRFAVSGDDAGIAKVWDLEAGTPVASLEGHSGAIVDVVMDAAAHRIVTASMDGSLKIWDGRTGALRHTLDEHHAALLAVAPVPGRDYAVSVGQDQTLRLWNLENGRQVAAFTAEGVLMSCAAAPDGQTIVAGEISGAVHILHIEGAGWAPLVPDPDWSSEPNRPDIAATAIAAAQQRQANEQWDEADQLYRAAIQLRIFLLGLANPLVAQSMNYLGLLYTERQEFASAEALFTAGLEIYERSDGPDSLNVGINLANLGFLYGRESWEKARPYLVRCVAILERHPGVAPAVLADALDGIAEAARGAGRSDEAAVYDARARTVRGAASV
jgi:WD40 repeat protein